MVAQMIIIINIRKRVFFFKRLKIFTAITREDILVKYKLDGASELDTLQFKKDMANKGIQIVEIQKDLDNLTGKPTGKGELKVRVPSNPENARQIVDEIKSKGIGLNQPESCYKDR